MFRLDNKIALVTGAGSGIRREIARLYARRGAHMVVAADETAFVTGSGLVIDGGLTAR